MADLGDLLRGSMPHTLTQAQLASQPLLARSWTEPLQPLGGQTLTRVDTLVRPRDVHTRVCAIAELFLDKQTRNELTQMVGQVLGGGKRIDMTWTLAEGQALMTNPVMAERMQATGIAAFYDWVYTVDMAYNRMEQISHILDELGRVGAGRASAPARMYQDQLDAILFSPHNVPWWMYDMPAVRAALVPEAGATRGPAKKITDWIQFMRLAVKDAGPDARAEEYIADVVDRVVKGNGDFTGAKLKDMSGDEGDAAKYMNRVLRHLYTSAQEAVLLASPLWNDLVALGQGLFRVQLTTAAYDMGLGDPTKPQLGVDRIERGKWVNAFRAGTYPHNVVPGAVDKLVFYPFGSNEHKQGEVVNSNVPRAAVIAGLICLPQAVLTLITAGAGKSFDTAVAQVRDQANKAAAAAAAKAQRDEDDDYHDMYDFEEDDFKNYATYVKSWFDKDAWKQSAKALLSDTPAATAPKEQPSDATTMAAAFLQPKICDGTLFEAVGMGVFWPPAARQKSQALIEQADAQGRLWHTLRDSVRHNGEGGAIGKYICNGTVPSTGLFMIGEGDGTGAFNALDVPGTVVVSGDALSKCMERLPPGHAMRHCARLVKAMQEAVVHDDADLQRMQLDAAYRPSAAPRTLFEFLRGKARDLQTRYAQVRSGAAAALTHPLGTAANIFAEGWGEQANRQGAVMPQCPSGTIPLVWDVVHNKLLSHQQWEKEVVEVNGVKMLPSHLTIQNCVPARKIM
jgi:hypothetical protein